MTALRRTGTIGRGLLALAVLLVLVAGVPAVLVATIGNPIPAGWGMSEQLSNQAILGIIACVAWVLWAQLVVCVMVETAAEIRLATGRSADWLARVPGTFGGQQALARALVQAVVAIGVAGTVVGSGTPWIAPADAAESLTLPPMTAASSAETVVPAKPAQRPARMTAVRVTVERGDSLWSLSERHLGAGERWREIAELNAGHQMRDGSTFDEARTIEPGWALLVPATAPAVPNQMIVTVERGDTLWEIADDEYGDGAQWPRIYDANQEMIEDPHWIYPGQRFTIPGVRDEQRDSDHHSHELVVPPQAAMPTEDTTPSTHSRAPAATPTAPATHTPAVTAETNDVPAASSDDSWHLDEATIARALLGGGGFLAAGTFATYVTRRRTQSRNRRSGRAVPSVAPSLRAADKALRAIGGQSLAPAAFFEAALRELAQLAEQHGFALPEVVAARIDAASLDLYLSAASGDAPDPWVSSPSGTTWSLSRDHEPLVSDRTPPYPTMVTLGEDGDGGVLFVDLEGAGVIQVVGDADVGADLVRFIAAELALNPWTDTEGVNVVGVAEEVVPLNQGRLFIDPRLDVDRLTKIARRMRESVADAGLGVLAARVADWGNAWVPSVTIAAVDGPDDEIRARVSELIDEMDQTHGRTSLALLTLSTEAHTERAVILRAVSNGLLSTPWGEVRANRMTPAEARTLSDMFEDADRDGDEPIPAAESAHGQPQTMDAAGSLVESLTEDRCTTGDPGSVLPCPDHVYIEAAATTEEDLAVLAPAVSPSEAAAVLAQDPALDTDLAEWAQDETDRPRLRVLGPVELRAAGEKTKEIDSRPAYFAELAAYLSCHPNGLTPNQFAADFGIQNNTLHTRLGQLRKWLSTKPGGDEWYLPNAQRIRGQQVYRLEGILADDDLFRRLRARAEARGPEGIDDLCRALELVAGPPYDQQRPKGYGWLVDTPHDHYLTAGIVDIAHVVATHALAEGDPHLALWAAEKAILAAPSEDKPRLDLARAMKAMGHVDEADAYLDEQVLNRTDDDRPPLDASDRTMQVLRDMRG